MRKSLVWQTECNYLFKQSWKLKQQKQKRNSQKNKACCCVTLCHNSYQTLVKWSLEMCTAHNVLNDVCGCPPPFELINFPTKKKDSQKREIWKKLINRRDEKGNLWTPRKSSRVCSSHFDNSSDYPTVNLGYDSTSRVKALVPRRLTLRRRLNMGAPRSHKDTEADVSQGHVPDHENNDPVNDDNSHVPDHTTIFSAPGCSIQFNANHDISHCASGNDKIEIDPGHSTTVRAPGISHDVIETVRNHASMSGASRNDSIETFSDNSSTHDPLLNDSTYTLSSNRIRNPFGSRQHQSCFKSQHYHYFTWGSSA